MKILFLCSDTNQIGGIQQYNRKLLQVLTELNHSVKLIERKNSFLSKIVFTFSFFKAVIFFRPEIIFCRHVNYAPLAYLAKNFFGTRYSLSFYGIDAQNLNFWQKSFINRAEVITVPFEWTRNNIIKQIPGSAQKTIVIMNPVDENEFFIKPKSDGLIKKHGLENSKVILTMARISKEEVEMGNKGYSRVIQALSIVKKQIPNIKYLLVGGGDYLEETKKIVKDSGLENDIIFTGAVKDDERIDYYNLCDVFVLPSKSEGCPALVVLEALLCGKPVVIGERECSKNALSGGELGLMINPDNIQIIADAVIEILSGKNSRILASGPLRQKTIEIYGFNNFRASVKKLI